MSSIVGDTFSAESFERFLESRDEPIWRREARRAAWSLFESLPMPDRSIEEWARTDIRGFRWEQFAGLPGVERPQEIAATSGTEAAPDSVGRGLLGDGVELAGRMVSLDGSTVECVVAGTLAQRGIVFGPIEDVLRQRPDVLRPHLFGPTFDPRADKFSAYHAACWHGGGALYVPPYASAGTVHLLMQLSPSGIDLSHQLIVLDEGAEATVLVETAGPSDGAAALHCGAVEIVVGRGAKLTYVNLQNWGTGVWHFAQQKARVAREGSIQWTVGALGARLAHVSQHVVLAEPDAAAQVNGVMFTEGRQHLNYLTLQHHQAPGGRSDLLYKGALQDRSRIVWRGMIRVDLDAQKTDGYQRNDNLMLSNDARADSIPGLEILADDVKCTHGATAGRVEDEMIFYLGTRGLTRKEAARMVVAGFFQQVFDRITIESVRHALAEAIGRRVREYR